MLHRVRLLRLDSLTVGGKDTKSSKVGMNRERGTGVSSTFLSSQQDLYLRGTVHFRHSRDRVMS